MPFSNVRSALTTLHQALAAWGVWPACVMVLCQMEAASACGEYYPLAIAAVTAAGTLGIYFADRAVERYLLQNLSERHRPTPLDAFFPFVILALLLVAYPDRDQIGYAWVGMLGSLGLAYVLITAHVVSTPPLLKELLGGWIFSFLVFDWIPGQDILMVLAFLPLATANFMLASHQDRERDLANGLHSLAVRSPLVNQMLARILAMFTAGFFFEYMGLSSLFGWVAITHAGWPSNRHVDLAFLPLLAAPWFYFHG